MLVYYWKNKHTHIKRFFFFKLSMLNWMSINHPHIIEALIVIEGIVNIFTVHIAIAQIDHTYTEKSCTTTRHWTQWQWLATQIACWPTLWSSSHQSNICKCTVLDLGRWSSESTTTIHLALLKDKFTDLSH